MKSSINKTLFILATATSISMAALTVHAQDSVSSKTDVKTERQADGDYTSKMSEESKDANGVKTSSESKVDVDVDSDGTYKKTIKSQAVKDPKGMLNKSVAESSETVKSDDGKYSDKSSVEYKNGATGTKTTKDMEVKAKEDDNGNVDKTIESKVTTDPKGLFNKKSVKITNKVETNDNGKTKYHHVKKVNGKTVEDTSTNTK